MIHVALDEGLLEKVVDVTTVKQAWEKSTKEFRGAREKRKGGKEEKGKSGKGEKGSHEKFD